MYYFVHPSEIQTHILCIHILQIKQNFLLPVKHGKLISADWNNNGRWQLYKLKGLGTGQNAFSNKVSGLRTF